MPLIQYVLACAKFSSTETELEDDRNNETSIPLLVIRPSTYMLVKKATAIRSHHR
jgi:hypothetical protein